tara:strand:- start:1992 stop:2381 length:390 start_codon:yes stop_codon:yes gene_type:complete
MWSHAAHLVFLLLMAIIYHRIIRSTLHYGRRLRKLRQTCEATIGKLEACETPDDDDIIVVVREKDTQRTVYMNNCSTNEKELLRIMNDSQVREQVVVFKHIPDAEHMSHIIGVYKDANKKYECLACIHT